MLEPPSSADAEPQRCTRSSARSTTRPFEIRQGLEVFYAAIERGSATAGLAGVLLHDIGSTRNDEGAREERPVQGRRDGKA